MPLVVRNFSQLDQSDTDEAEIDENVKQSRVKHEFEKVATFATLDQAKKALKSRNFSYNYRVSANTATQRERKDVYRCNNLKYRAEVQCEAVTRLVYKIESFEIESNNKDHTCGYADEESVAKVPLNDDTKTEIRKLYIARIRKPSRVLVSLRASNQRREIYETEPSRNQIVNELKKLRKEFNVDGEISLRDLHEHIESQSEVPNDVDKAFVIGKKFVYAQEDISEDSDESGSSNHEETTNNERSFWFLMSTKRLLSLAAGCDVICADATFKFCWLGFPAILFGTVDKMKQFHPIAFGITSQENTEMYAEAFKALQESVFSVTGKNMKVTKLLADAAWEIKKGFLRQFPSAKVLMCWYHAAVKIRARAEKYFKRKDKVEKVMKDVYALQLSKNSETFYKASDLFLAKYSASPSFTGYFKSEWIDKNPNWYEGASSLTTPTTQCGQESTHGKIKMTFMGFERVSMNEMKVLCAEIVNNFSLDLKNVKPYAHDPKITDKELANAYKFSKKDIKFIEETCESGEVYWISSEDSLPIKAKQVRAIKEMTWKTFDEFSSVNFEAHEIRIDEDGQVTCSCRSFMKNFKCVHSVGFSIIKKLTKVPANIKKSVKIPLPSSQKRGPGRPKKMTKALLK